MLTNLAKTCFFGKCSLLLVFFSRCSSCASSSSTLASAAASLLRLPPDGGLGGLGGLGGGGGRGGKTTHPGASGRGLPPFPRWRTVLSWKKVQTDLKRLLEKGRKHLQRRRAELLAPCRARSKRNPVQNKSFCRKHGGRIFVQDPPFLSPI